METTDILIIGAGVVGLAIAKELGGRGKEVVLVEKNSSFGQETSSRNSEAGIDIEQCKYKLNYCKGQYFRVKSSKAGLIKGLVYPVPKPKSGGLGIHGRLSKRRRGCGSIPRTLAFAL